MNHENDAISAIPAIEKSISYAFSMGYMSSSPARLTNLTGVPCHGKSPAAPSIGRMDGFYRPLREHCKTALDNGTVYSSVPTQMPRHGNFQCWRSTGSDWEK
jgi:hypothetical protein